jgi:N-acetylmuramoyl-L-alanine amidase
MSRGESHLRNFFVLFLLIGPSLAHTGLITGLRLGDTDERTRIVIESDEDIKYQVFTLTNPSRLVVDFPGTDFAENFSTPSTDGASITRIRTGNPSSGTARLVFDVPREPEKPEFFNLSATSDTPSRIVVDIPRSSGKDPVKSINDRPKREILIAIDAGHGGKDPGAIGPRNRQEKEVVMAIAKKLAREINKTHGYKAILVRDDDTYVPLVARREFARKHKADLFISIHADAFTKSAANGASVYMISNRSATSAMANYLAKTSNATISGIVVADKDPDLMKILSSMSLEGTMTASMAIGSTILSELGTITRLHSQKVEQAPFAVLKSPDVPSLLIETGFISNPRESERLVSNWYQAKMASAIHRGIVRHFNDYSPTDSVIYAMRSETSNKGTIIASRDSQAPVKPIIDLDDKPSAPLITMDYKVQRGDTLSEIAALYALSTSDLLSLNNMTSARLRVGQSLRVPGSESQSMNYTVRRGDSVSVIASRFNVSPILLAKQNNIKKGLIKIGQKLTIPADEPLAYVVRDGDTLSEIANQYGVTVADIRRFNQLSGTSIRVGQSLLIPAK